MTNALYTVAGAVLVLGVMILVHEFGHFAAAKLLGVRVEVFSLGFGKRLLGFRHGDTDYRISALPLGGYVKMTGVNAVEMPEERASLAAGYAPKDGAPAGVGSDVGGFADLGGEFVDLAFQDVADGEDSDEAAIVFDHGEVALLVVDHDRGGFGDGGGTGGQEYRGGHHVGDGNLMRVAAAEGDAGHDVALGEDSGDDAVFIDHGGGAHAALDHGLDGVGGGGGEGDSGGIGGTIFKNVHGGHVDERVPLKRTRRS